MDLTTTARVKLAAQGLNTVSTEDTRIAQFITDCSAAVETYIDRSLGYATGRAEYFNVDASASRVFALRAYPALANVVVYSDIAHQTSTYTQFPSTTIIDASSYAVDADRGLLIFDYFRPLEGARALKVSYDGGIATTATTAALFAVAYPDLARATELLVVQALNQSALVGAISTSEFGRATSFDGSDWPPMVRALLARYRRPAIG